MTEKTEHAAGVENPRIAEPNVDPKPPEQEPVASEIGPSVKVKCERPDAEVEAKLRALNAKYKAEALAASQSTSKDREDESEDSEASSAEDKKDIVPVKSSNEILAELFGVFNAAPPEELLDDKNLLKKKKVKKEKKEKKSKRKKSPKSDGECSDANSSEGKHKRKRKKHKHKHKDSKDKDKVRDREKSKEKIPLAGGRTTSTDKTTTTGKDKVKSENRKRSSNEVDSHSDSHSLLKRERSERNRDREKEKGQNHERDRDHGRERERDRSGNSFYNGRDAAQPRDTEAESKSRQSHDVSDVSLSDEESFLREKASNGRRRPHHNPFYDGKEEPKSEPKEEKVPRPEPPQSKRRGRDHDSRRQRRSRSRSRSRSRDLGIDKKRLLEIARKNAINMFKRGTLPGVANMTPEVKDKVLVKMRYGGRTVQDLTDFCKKISNGDGLSDLSSDEDSDVDKNGNAKAFHHPFQLKEREPIVMHIRNATPLTPATARREDQTKAITMQFPVSSGQTHRMNEVWVPVEPKSGLAPLPSLPVAKQSTTIFKETQKNVFAKSIPPQDQQEPAFKSMGGPSVSPSVPSAPEPVPPPVPVTVDAAPPATAAPFVPEVPIPSATPAPKPAPSESIFPEVAPPSMDVGSIITQRLSAIRRLQDNPTDSEALKMMYIAQRNMSSWANSKHLPGQFTGSTGAQVMKAHELNSGPQLWVRKDQLTSTKPVTGGMGMALLQKMGWKPGEGLGRTKTGSLQPLLLDVKLDKRGLVSRDDLKPPQSRQPPVQRRNKNPPAPIGGPGPPGTRMGGAAMAGPPTGTCPPLITQDKHPVCVLNELTSKNKWTPPQYTLRENTGPPHCRTFLFSVEINGQTYTPDRGCNNKKEAKLNAAKLCLCALGILPPS
ncbi:protein Son [Drosophila bipectinata]|uniref:protein Son n=1 Tax=Drosophila bipectinata TaxID=42026 RepID=UPI001C896CBD|nr:protein Son [Drosophila bipectinata]